MHATARRRAAKGMRASIKPTVTEVNMIVVSFWCGWGQRVLRRRGKGE